MHDCQVHFIFKHENPISKAVEEKHANNAPSASVALETTLYTFVVNPDNTYEYFVNLESKAKGSLLETMEPPVNPPKEIDDPTDSKPDDWVDEAKIDDPVGAISVHGVCGIWGTIAVVITNPDASLVTQLTSIVVVGAFTFSVSLVLWYVLKTVIGIRVSSEDERVGLDNSELGMDSYPEFSAKS